MVSRTIAGMSTYPPVVISPAMCTWPVVIIVSTATRLRGSWASIASRIESLIWSAILSGWPSVTDSEVKRRRDMSYSWVGGTDRWLRGPRARYPAEALRWRGPALRPGGSGRPRRDRGPDPRRDGVLGPPRDLVGASVRRQHHDGVLRPAEDLARRHVVDDQQVASLAGQLRPSVGEH